MRAAWPVAAQSATPESSPRATPVVGAPFVEPPVLRSADGRLDVILTAGLSPTVIGGRNVISMTYNAQAPSPTLRLRPGETLGVTLVNGLAQPTNLHTHGLHVSPSGKGDNVFLHLMPGETFEFDFQIPADGISGLHIPGFYWYHPHLHGYTRAQVDAGMAGALIVEGGLDDLPEIAGLPERLLVLQSTAFDADGTMIPFPETEDTDLYINGQLQPTLTIAPGETQRWRLLNTSSFWFMNLMLDGHTWQQIASDGNPLREVWSRDVILLSPGERIDALIQGGAEGSYALRSLAWGEDIETQAQPERVLATLISTGEAVNPLPLPETLLPFDDLARAQIDRQREITFEETDDPFSVTIDGMTFDPDRIDQTVELGATEEWVIRNTSVEWHPFHIHVNDYQVMSVNGEPVAAHSWEDTTAVPGNGEIVIRTRFLDFPGKSVYHCHLLDHEDEGMMGVFEVVEGEKGEKGE